MFSKYAIRLHLYREPAVGGGMVALTTNKVLFIFLPFCIPSLSTILMKAFLFLVDIYFSRFVITFVFLFFVFFEGMFFSTPF